MASMNHETPSPTPVASDLTRVASDATNEGELRRQAARLLGQARTGSEGTGGADERAARRLAAGTTGQCRDAPQDQPDETATVAGVVYNQSPGIWD